MKTLETTKPQAAHAQPLKPLLIDVGQFMTLLRVSRSTANAMIREQKVRSLRIGRARRIVLADAERLVADALCREGR